MSNTREIATQILTDIYLKFEFFETAVLLSKNFSRLNQRDKAFVKYLVLNTLRRNGQVDKVINDYVNATYCFYEKPQASLVNAVLDKVAKALKE